MSLTKHMRPKCNVCGAPATKTSGDIEMYEIRAKGERVNVGVQYRCDACDPHDKWFDIEPDDDER
jgi:hypothetical protein